MKNVIIQQNDMGNVTALEIGAGKKYWIKGKNVKYMNKTNRFPITQKYNLIIHNLENTPYPFKDKEFSVICAREVLEHICPKKLPSVMNELHRILKLKGSFYLTVPYAAHPVAFSDPTHCSYFDFGTMKYFIDDKVRYTDEKPKWKIGFQIPIHNWEIYRDKTAKQLKHFKSLILHRLLTMIYRLTPKGRKIRHLYINMIKA